MIDLFMLLVPMKLVKNLIKDVKKEKTDAVLRERNTEEKYLSPY